VIDSLQEVLDLLVIDQPEMALVLQDDQGTSVLIDQGLQHQGEKEQPTKDDLQEVKDRLDQSFHLHQRNSSIKKPCENRVFLYKEIIYLSLPRQHYKRCLIIFLIRQVFSMNS
jgi:hypothetical protein